ncbi:MAG: hypothetical protein HY000_31740 [Planctomycetes bacterium]|nr:hypothetical protein [Planctomycetota bacterium]
MNIEPKGVFAGGPALRGVVSRILGLAALLMLAVMGFTYISGMVNRADDGPKPIRASIGPKPILYEGKTTAQWLREVKNVRTGKPSSDLKSIRYRTGWGPEHFIGADPAAIPDLFAALNDGDLYEVAWRILNKFTSDECKGAVPALVKELDGPQCRWAIELLKRSGPEAKQAIPALRGLAQKGDVKAVEALKHLEATEVPSPP